MTMSSTTNAVAQSRFDARDPEVSIMILPYGVRTRSPGRANLVPTRRHVNQLRYKRGLSSSWKRNISVVLSASLFLVGAIGNLMFF